MNISIGYQLVNRQIVRMDSQYLHDQTTKPALALLNRPGFAGPEQEFLRAHEHYRSGSHKEAINEACKAFESTMKAICAAREWTYDREKDTAKRLLEIVLEHGLVPSYLTNSFAGIRAVLETAVPTTRNRTSGHGQGPEPIELPDYFAAYVLHSAASAIVFLVEAHEDVTT